MQRELVMDSIKQLELAMAMDLTKQLCIFSRPSRKGKYCLKQLEHAFG